MDEKSKRICNRCGVELVPQNVDLEYLGYSFHADVPRCPQCGQVFLPEELVRGRVAEVEYELEDK